MTGEEAAQRSPGRGDGVLEGFGQAHADLVQVHLAPPYVSRAGGAVAGKVGLVSGGGSGHEPLHAGFVGPGMLDAAVPGAVFTSPTPDQIVPAILRADSGAGVLAIVKNYTGDVLNFETAVELVEAEGTQVTSILVNDDVAVEDSLYTAGRRGVAGTVAVEKIAGAAAERGDDLGTVTEIAGRVVANVRSMGVALTACTVPHVGRPSFDLADDEVEIGIGIHGEPGRHRIPLASADEITQRLVDPWRTTWASPTARTCCCSLTEWAVPRCPSCTSSIVRRGGCSKGAAYA